MDSLSAAPTTPTGAAEQTTAAATGDPLAAPAAAAKRRGAAARKANKPSKDDSTSSSSTSSSYSAAAKGGGVRLRSRRCGTPARRGAAGDNALQDLALPLGMSFAAVLAQVLDGKNVSQERMPLDQLSKICTSAIKESVRNIYGERFDCFVRNFEKSFVSTLRTLRVINEACISEHGNGSISETFEGGGNANRTLRSNCVDADTRMACEPLNVVEGFQDNQQVNSVNSQLILHGRLNQQLSHVSGSIAGPRYNQSSLSTIERSVIEQTRSNDLKAVEIGLTMRKLQLKQAHLDLNSYANFLDKIKICMGLSKASFKEEKLRNQMQDMRYAELLKRCTDLLIAGIVIMSCFLGYGTYIYSYRRIVEVTSSCSSTVKESKSWWVPKQVSSLSSAWFILSCHVQVLSRMTFGLLMILVVAYSVFQRSGTSGSSTMPVTFNLLLLGAVCGVAGKFCVDTLGGSGYCWLLYWEPFCLIHFFANVFPSLLYYILYGPVSVSQGARAMVIPYRQRRLAFYTLMLLIIPTSAGLLPFASLHDWKEHFRQKVAIWSLGNKNGD